MSGYRNQRQGSTNNTGSIGPGGYDNYSRHRYSEQSQQPPGSVPQSNYAGSTYKPRGGSSYQYRGDDRDRRDRYPSGRRDYYSMNNYQPRNRDGYYSRPHGARGGYNSYNGGHRDRPTGESYSSYDDRRPRDQPGTRYGQRPPNSGSPSLRQDDVRRPDTLEYEQNPATSYESYRPPSSRPSLIPKDFNDDDEDEDDDDDDEDLILGSRAKSMSDNSEQASDNASKRETPENSTDEGKAEVTTESNVADIVAAKIPLSIEHKEELDEDTNPSSEDDEQEVEEDREVKLSPEVKPQILTISESVNVEPSHQDLPKKEFDSQGAPNDEQLDYKAEANAPSSVDDALRAAVIVMEKTLTENETKLPDQFVTIEKPLESKLITPLSTPESCCFPLPKNEQRLWELKNHPRQEVVKRLPYLLKTPVKSFGEYPFYERNFLVHKQGVLPRLRENISIIKGTTYSRKISLLNEYSHREGDSLNRREEMSAQLRHFYPSPKEDEDNKEQPDAEGLLDSRRRSRHADVVRSEAEFEEILRELEEEKQKDPMYRAEQVAAKIPDMILNPLERSLKMASTNNLLTDKSVWAERIRADAIDTFTKREHEMFCEAFLSFPKRFGRISHLMGGLRTPEECVLHYYKTKKSVTDYKQLLAMRKKTNKRAAKGRRGKSKNGPSGTPAIVPTESSDDKELNLENFVPKEAPEEFYTDTGRRRRAAAPVFESEKKTLQEVPVIDEPERTKRPLEPTSAGENLEEDKKLKKKPRGPKPKKAEPSVTAEVSSETDQKTKNNISSYWSVKDSALFTKLLGEVGTDWNYIAAQLGTKSATMVRNFYMRNSDTNDWKEKTPDDERRSSVAAAQLQKEAQHRNPPLGFFSAPSNVPSNVNFVHQALQTEPEERPMLHPTTHTNPSIILPAMKSLLTFQQQQELPSLQPMDHSQNAIYSPQSGEPRANPFSITNLLNPPEEKQPPVFPTTGRFSPVPQKTEVYSAFSGDSHGNDSNVDKALKSRELDPLDALLAAAEEDKAGRRGVGTSGEDKAVKRESLGSDSGANSGNVFNSDGGNS